MTGSFREAMFGGINPDMNPVVFADRKNNLVKTLGYAPAASAPPTSPQPGKQMIRIDLTAMPELPV